MVDLGTASIANDVNANRVIVGAAFADSSNHGFGRAARWQPPVESFATFTAGILRTRNAFNVGGVFTLGSASDGIDPATQQVTITVGAYSATLPPGALSGANGRFSFNGAAGGATLNLVIVRTTANTFLLGARVSGFRLAAGTAAVGLAIGNDAGSATVR